MGNGKRETGNGKQERGNGTWKTGNWKLEIARKLRKRELKQLQEKRTLDS